jgi:membrane protease YdiL (CAAX protease family)
MIADAEDHGQHTARLAVAQGEPLQYTGWQILGVWAAAALPGGILAWGASPLIGPLVGSITATRLLMITLGLIWQCLLVLVLVRHEAGNLRWSTLRQRLWLTTPRHPATGKAQARLWWWVLPFLILYGLDNSPLSLSKYLNALWVKVFPFLTPPGIANLSLFITSHKAELLGAWWFLALFLVSALFNTVLGEELLFRGLLLPRMRRVFGRWDWIVNAVLFGFYHLTEPWTIPQQIVAGLLFAWPSRRFRSSWMGIFIHSAQSVFLGVLILGIVLGKA